MINQGEEEYEIESIIKSRRKGCGHKLQYLVHWKGYPSADDSWVDEKDVHTPELLETFNSHSAMAGRTNV